MDAMFLQNQQQLAFKVALLPLLRKEYDDERQKCRDAVGSYSRSQQARVRYEQCLADIKALAEQM